MSDQSNSHEHIQYGSLIEVICGFLMLIWLSAKLVTGSFGSFAPIVTDELVVAWVKFIGWWCLVISSGLALGRGIYLCRSHGFKWKNGHWFIWGVTQPLYAIVMGVMLLDASSSFESLKSKLPNSEQSLERFMSSEYARDRWDVSQMIAREIFVDTGEYREHMNELGRVVTFVPTEDDLKSREKRLLLVLQMRDSVKNIWSGFLVWGITIAMALFGGFFFKIEPSMSGLKNS